MIGGHTIQVPKIYYLHESRGFIYCYFKIEYMLMKLVGCQ